MILSKVGKRGKVKTIANKIRPIINRKRLQTNNTVERISFLAGCLSIKSTTMNNGEKRIKELLRLILEMIIPESRRWKNPQL